MIYFFLFAAALIFPFVHGNVKGDKCDPPVVPMYLPDNHFGSYCRYSPEYSQIDFVFLINVSTVVLDCTLIQVSRLLFTSLILPNANFSNSSLTNDAAFVFFADRTMLGARFGTLNSVEEVREEFQRLIYYKAKLNSPTANYTLGLQFIDESVLDYNNNRSKMVTVIGNFDASQNSYDIQYAEKMKAKGVKIFSIAYNYDLTDINMTNSYLSKISTPGWILPLISSGVANTSSSLSTTFNNFARQAGCLCPPGTTQFSTLVPSSNPNMPAITELYADCVYKVQDSGKLTFENAEIQCQSDINFNERLIALNSSAKWEFTKNFLGAEQNFFWSGKNGNIWMNYVGEPALLVNYIPSSYNDSTLQGICRNTFHIKSGSGAAIGSKFLCEASSEMLFLPLCEIRAYDSMNNPKFCAHGNI